MLPLLISLFFLLWPWQGWAQEADPGFAATLRLEKPIYLLGEQVRFWVGMRSTNRSPIPLDSPCTLSVTKPDGSTVTQSLGPPPDRMLEATIYEGGMGLGDNIQAGKYVLIWECSNQRTKPVELTVERNEIFDQVRAQFRFERTGTVKMGSSVPVVLSVDNNSPYTIHFPERGVAGAEVSVEATREKPPESIETFYPADEQSHSQSAPETYTWDDVPEVPSIVLKPGEHFEQQFLFEHAYSFAQPGKYKVTISTVLQLLVGEKDGPFAQVCPIRVLASGAEQLEVVK
ncbi:MAG: hypothetical protein ACLQVL_22915 [Terriglobia bacterium]